MTRYPESVEREMRLFFETLSEKDRRRYAAIEARKLGHGGQKYIAEVLGCNRETIRRGLAELGEELASDRPGRVRGVKAQAASPTTKRTQTSTSSFWRC